MKMENCVIKGEMNVHDLVCHCSTGEDDDANSEEKMLGSVSACCFTHSTPYISWKADGVQDSAQLTSLSTNSVDSGFSEGTFNLTWTSSIKETPFLHTLSPPGSEVSGNRRHNLINSKFSPVNRCSSGTLGRKLCFTEFELHPSVPSTESCAEAESLSNHVESLKEEHILTNPLSTLHKCEGQSNSGSPHFDDLEISLQEMSLDETSSSRISPRTSPVQFQSGSNNEVQDKAVEEKIISLSREEAKTSSQLDKHVWTSGFDKCSEISQIPFGSQTGACAFKSLHSQQSSKQVQSHHCLDSEILKLDRHTKQEFLNKLSLTPTSSAEFPQSRAAILRHKALRKPTSKHLGVVAEKFHESAILPHPSFSLESAHFRVPPLPHEYTLPQKVNFSGGGSRTQYTADDSSFVRSSPTDYNPFRSPSKRCGDNVDDCILLFSPTKVRRTDASQKGCMGEGKTAKIKSPKQSFSRKILTEGGQHPVVHNTVTRVFEDLQHNSASPQCPTCSSLATGLCKDPRGNSSFKCHLCSSKNSGLGGKKTVPVNSFNREERTAELLQRVLEKFSPPDPVNLIGRNVGVRKFDFVHELHCRNFLLCLEKIFQTLTDADLMSVAMVSISWKLALFNDRKAYNRYRQYKKTLSGNTLQNNHGKENCGKKSLNSPSRQLLTAPRGLLSSIQSQAKNNVIPEPPAASVRDTLMSEDTLRICPHCQNPAVIQPHQDRATCMNVKCSYDFCTLCFSSFHHPGPCKPLCKAPSKGDVAGTKKSKKNLKRL